ncbi:hypothetical protein M430DRAFT_258169 [Amorphotheca resinae ATCC 22711]|jgi:hypothetical protein|uniref:AMP-dependent synthetase/ligase domain-containing protein n=1 Tax=Amorphotheca resinae ATCC 22711 TaxID=857342 RepID=A0A2T3AYS8_AMORE|nr:hypothetical protein M430DRAFT_258169 [Amorphotheca resinae ATCC 22711]PSS15218.1 hypothetical protein M430DRAFT_258169 [Amorphotheca resinae ATCC 22711]
MMDSIAKPSPTVPRPLSKDESAIPTVIQTEEKSFHRNNHFSISTWSTFDDLEKGGLPELPEKRYPRFLRHARHTFFNVYRRLFSIVFLFNLIGLAGLLSRNSDWYRSPPLAHFATAASANIMVALLIRQDYIVNACYKMTWLVPLSAPLRLRRILAKVYEHGGVHSGAAVSSVMWFCLLTGFVTREFAINQLRDAGLMTFTYILLSLLLTLVVTAYPAFRFMSHNTFESVHRWGGWFSLALFWIELILFGRTQARLPGAEHLGIILIKLPAFWFLFVSSLHAILPWLRLHKMPVQPEELSGHAIRLHFKEPVPLFVGVRISDAPLKEWHSFACIPSRDGGKSGGSVLISDAGDWTRRTIANPRPYYWIKGIPVTGVLCVARIFRRIVIVTTGSGIGPCLGVMQDIPQTHCRVVWSTPNPYVTYGEGIVNAVTDVDPRAVIWDTRKAGRPDLVRMAYELYKEENAEAVFVISNPKLTRKVVYGMESRGIPAFGPIWDS